MVLGWRTWFGPVYVEAYGGERLLGLPDTTVPLDDGGVRHSLAASATTLACGRRGVYQHVWPYVDKVRLDVAWPRRPKPRKGAPNVRDEDAESALARADIQTLLSRSYVLTDGTRKKFLHVRWNVYAALARTVAIETVQQVLEQELRTHPDQVVSLELSERPDDLLRVLDSLASDTGRLTYTVADRFAEFDIANDKPAY